MGPFSDRQRAAMARCHNLVRRGRWYVRRRSSAIDEADAHDIAVDALIRATRRHDDPPWPLYAHCLRRSFVDWARSPRNLRGHGRRGNARPMVAEIDFRDDGDWIVAPAPDVSAIDDADALLASLPIRQRRALELEFRGGYPRAEIAAMFGVSEATIYNERAEAFARARGEPIPSRTRRRKPQPQP